MSTTITINDARTYLGLLIAAGPQGTAAYEDFITKYATLDAAQGRQPDLS